MAPRKHPEQPESSEPLLSLILLGIAASTLVGAIFFYLFAWQQKGPFGNFFLTGLTGQQLFDSARTTVTLVGIVGLGGAAFIAYRRQRTTESAQRTALNALALGQQQFGHDSVRALRERYTAATEQLGSDSFAVRLAGLYAIAALADDWRASGEPGEQQTCIDVICAYLRTPTVPVKEVPDDDGEMVFVDDVVAGSEAEHEVRRTAVRIIAERTRPRAATPPAPDSYAHFVGGPWSDRRFDLTGAQLIDANFSSCTFDDLDLSNARLIGNTTFSNSTLRQVRFMGARLYTHGLKKGGANFSGAHLETANFIDIRVLVPCTFEGTQFWESATFRGASFTGSVSFVSAHFHESSSTLFHEVDFGTDHITFARAHFNGPVDFSKVDFTFTERVRIENATGTTPPGIAPDTRDRFRGWPWSDDTDPDSSDTEDT